jgi:hypothetical protein
VLATRQRTDTRLLAVTTATTAAAAAAANTSLQHARLLFLLSLQQITRSMGGGVAALSMDEEFQRNRIERDRRRSGGDAGTHGGVGSGDRTSALRLMGRAGRDMAGGLWAGVTGIIVEPARGLRHRGLRGFLIGICHGVAGVATKPMVGCLDAVTHAGEAVREMAGGLTAVQPLPEVRRRRHSQVFGLDGRLMRYSLATARGAALLEQFPPRCGVRDNDPLGLGGLALELGTALGVVGGGASDAGTATDDDEDSSNRAYDADDRGSMGADRPTAAGGISSSSAHYGGRHSLQQQPQLQQRRGSAPNALPTQHRAAAVTRQHSSQRVYRSSERLHRDRQFALMTSGLGSEGGAGAGGAGSSAAYYNSSSSSAQKDFVVLVEVLKHSPTRSRSTVLVVSNTRIICIAAESESPGRHHFSLEWEAFYDNMAALPLLEPNAGSGVTLTVSTPAPAEHRSRAPRPPRNNRYNSAEPSEGQYSNASTVSRGNATATAASNSGYGYEAASSSGTAAGANGGLSFTERAAAARSPLPSGVSKTLETLSSMLNVDAVAAAAGVGGGGRSAAVQKVSGDYSHRAAIERVHNAVVCLMAAPTAVVPSHNGDPVAGAVPASDGFFAFNGWEFGDEAAAPAEWSWSVHAAVSPRSAHAASAPQADLWALLCYCTTAAVGAGGAVTLRARPRRMVFTALAYEMDAVPWREGPWQLGSESGPNWLVAAHSEATAAAQHLRALLQQSEPAPWDTRALSASKEDVRLGTISRAHFAAVLQQESARIIAAAAAGGSAEELDVQDSAVEAATGVGRGGVRSGGAKDLLRRSGSRLVSSIKARSKLMPFVGSSNSSSTTNPISSAAVEISPPAPSLLQRSAAAAAALNTACGSSGVTPTRPVAASRYSEEAALASRDRGMRSASSSPRSTTRGVAHSLSNSSGPHRHDASDAPVEKASASELAVYDQLSSVSQASVSSTVLTDLSNRMERIETMLGELLAAGEAEQAAPPAPVERSSRTRRGILRQRSAEGAAISSRSSSNSKSSVGSANASALTATAREIAAAKEHLAVLKAQDALQRRSYTQTTAQQTATQSAQLSQSERGSSGRSKLHKFAKNITLFSTKRTTSSSSSYDSEGVVESRPRSTSALDHAAPAAGTAAAATAAASASSAAATATPATTTAESSDSTEHRRGRLSTIAEDRSRSMGRSSDFEFTAALAQDEVLHEQQGELLTLRSNNTLHAHSCLDNQSQLYTS